MRIGLYNQENKSITDTMIITAVVRELYKYGIRDLEVCVPAYLELFDNNPKIKSIKQGTTKTHQVSVGFHYIEKHCRYFGIKPTQLKGEIFLTDQEKEWAKEAIQTDKPILILSACPEIKLDVWTKFVKDLSNKYYIVQIGKKVPDLLGADTRFKNEGVRQICALIARADKYFGDYRDYYHIATALDIPAVTLWPRYDGELLNLSEFGYPQQVNLLWDVPYEKVLGWLK